MLCHNVTLPEVCNFPQTQNLPCGFVAKEKRTAVYFDRVACQFVGLSDARIKQLEEAYPGIDVGLQLKRMGIWLTGPKGLKREGSINFIMNWLNMSTPTAPTIQNTDDTPLRPEINSYLKDLWQGKEHLLEMNKRKS